LSCGYFFKKIVTVKMKELKLKLLGEPYRVTSQKENESPENTVVISPLPTEKVDFALSANGIAQTAALILAGYFLLIFRGLPLNSVSFLLNGRKTDVFRDGAYLFAPFTPVPFSTARAVFLGVETELYEGKRERVVIFKSEKEPKGELLENIRLYGNGVERRLLPVFLDGRDYRVFKDTTLSFDSLILIFSVLRGKMGSLKSLRLLYRGESFYLKKDGGSLKLGARPSIN
jgi:hypothetical protein